MELLDYGFVHTVLVKNLNGSAFCSHRNALTVRKFEHLAVQKLKRYIKSRSKTKVGKKDSEAQRGDIFLLEEQHENFVAAVTK